MGPDICDVRRNFRRRAPLFPLIRCPVLGALNSTLPRAEILIRFFSPLCVFIFGMTNPHSATRHHVVEDRQVYRGHRWPQVPTSSKPALPCYRAVAAAARYRRASGRSTNVVSQTSSGRYRIGSSDGQAPSQSQKLARYPARTASPTRAGVRATNGSSRVGPWGRNL